MVTFTVEPLSEKTWPALEDLFGPSGASSGCWCMYPRLGPSYWKRPREENRADLHHLASTTPSFGLLAFDADLCIGWCHVAPRTDLAWINQRPMYGPTTDEETWATPCFFVRRSHRHLGVADALLEAAIPHAREAGATILEACPADTAIESHTWNMFPGIASTFARHGFQEVRRRRKDRPIMRLTL
jgi:GNAT superfamily N-acetyltransferase